jgi:hypothetical protein
MRNPRITYKQKRRIIVIKDELGRRKVIATEVITTKTIWRAIGSPYNCFD